MAVPTGKKFSPWNRVTGCRRRLVLPSAATDKRILFFHQPSAVWHQANPIPSLPPLPHPTTFAWVVGGLQALWGTESTNHSAPCDFWSWRPWVSSSLDRPLHNFQIRRDVITGGRGGKRRPRTRSESSFHARVSIDRGRLYGVSHNSIYRWCRRDNFPRYQVFCWCDRRLGMRNVPFKVRSMPDTMEACCLARILGRF